MAIFKKDDIQQHQKPRERMQIPTRGSGSGDGAISIIGHGMTVVGDVTTEGVVRVEGQVQGTVRAAKAVILGQGGFVDGNVETEDAVIGGTVSGSIVANNRVELQSTCTVRGEIRTRAEHLKLEEGARFAGQIHIMEEAAEISVPGSMQDMGAEAELEPLATATAGTRQTGGDDEALPPSGMAAGPAGGVPEMLDSDAEENWPLEARG